MKEITAQSALNFVKFTWATLYIILTIVSIVNICFYLLSSKSLDRLIPATNDVFYALFSMVFISALLFTSSFGMKENILVRFYDYVTNKETFKSTWAKIVSVFLLLIILIPNLYFIFLDLVKSF